jgi:hypothetical protein
MFTIVSPVVIKTINNILSKKNVVTQNPSEYVLRIKRANGIGSGMLCNMVSGGWILLVYHWLDRLQNKAIPFLVIILLCFWSVGFYCIISEITVFYRIKVMPDVIQFNKLFFSGCLKYEDISSYLYFKETSSWIIYYTYKGRKYNFAIEASTTNANQFIDLLKNNDINSID